MSKSSGSRTLAWALVALGLVVEILIAGSHQYRAREPLRSLERAAVDAAPAAERTLKTPFALDASNRVAWTGLWRDARVTGSAELEAGAILEIRLRTPSAPDPVGSSARGGTVPPSNQAHVARYRHARKRIPMAFELGGAYPTQRYRCGFCRARPRW